MNSFTAAFTLVALMLTLLSLLPQAASQDAEC